MENFIFCAVQISKFLFLSLLRSLRPFNDALNALDHIHLALIVTRYDINALQVIWELTFYNFVKF